MSFVEEVKQKLENRNNSEEVIKRALRDAILVAAQNGRREAQFGGLAFLYLVTDSKWEGAESIDKLTYNQVISAAQFVRRFLAQEGFNVKISVSESIYFDITWENN